jgi:hypothetical protein
LKKEIFYLSVLLMLIPFTLTYSQKIIKSNNDKVFQFKGKLIDSENNPVAFAHVVNLRRKNNATTDSLGYFKLLVVTKDTLRITGIGYVTKYIGIDEKFQLDTTTHIIRLEKKVYDLPTVNVYELRWQIFKSEFMEQKVEEDKTAQRISNWMANLVPSDELRMIFQAARGPGFRIPYKSKAEKSRRKVAKLEQKYAIISPKFNDKLITNLTGLQGKDIYKFLQYCNFEDEFLIQSTEYEIIEEILVKWEEFKKVMPKKK